MKGLGFLLLLALKIAYDQGAVFDYSQSSESVGVFNGGDEGKQVVFDFSHENGDHNNTYKSGDERLDRGSVSTHPDGGGDCRVAGFVSICESGGGRNYNEVSEYGCGNAYIDSVSQVGTAMYCSK